MIVGDRPHPAKPHWAVCAAAAAFGLVFSSSTILSSEIIDRIAISVGKQVITESQIDEDIRLTAFLNKQKVDLDLPERKKAAARLIEQSLIRRDMELSRYPIPELKDADPPFNQIKGRYPSAAEFDEALKQYGIDEASLRQRLWWQETFLQFIEYRFRPGIQIQDSDVQAYYQRELTKWKQEGLDHIPSLEDSRSSIEQSLTEQRIDEELERWLQDARTRVAVKFHDETLK